MNYWMCQTCKTLTPHVLNPHAECSKLIFSQQVKTLCVRYICGVGAVETQTYAGPAVNLRRTGGFKFWCLWFGRLSHSSDSLAVLQLSKMLVVV